MAGSYTPLNYILGQASPYTGAPAEC
jgi:hypothetical protein